MIALFVILLIDPFCVQWQYPAPVDVVDPLIHYQYQLQLSGSEEDTTFIGLTDGAHMTNFRTELVSRSPKASPKVYLGGSG